MSLYFLGGECGIWGHFSPKYTIEIWAYKPIPAYWNKVQSAHDCLQKRVQSGAGAHDNVHIMQLSEVDHKNNTVKSNKGLLQPPSQTTMMTRGMTSDIPNQDAGRVK